MNTKVFAAIAGVLATAPAWAADEQETLKPGPGKEVVENNCATCHSLDYIRTNAPFLDGKKWDAEVTKMIKVFGAPITDADAKKIIEYLSATYGG